MSQRTSRPGALGEELHHPSYGLIKVGHIHGRNQVLFGSSIKHSEVIRITVTRAHLNRHLHADSYYQEGEIVEIDLSYSQFVEFITTHDRGTGVPCTIRWVQGEGTVEQPPFDNKREQHTQEFSDKMVDIGRKLDDLRDTVEALLQQPTVSKKERQELLHKVNMARQRITCDLPFAVKQFHEQMDLSVREAKGEIEGFALRRLLVAGHEALQHEALSQPPQLALEGMGDAPDAGGSPPQV